jgi:hypothetical protein
MSTTPTSSPFNDVVPTPLSVVVGLDDGDWVGVLGATGLVDGAGAVTAGLEAGTMVGWPDVEESWLAPRA